MRVGCVYEMKEEVHPLRHLTDQLRVVALVFRPFQSISKSEHTVLKKLISTSTVKHYDAYLSNSSRGRSFLSITLALNL